VDIYYQRNWTQKLDRRCQKLEGTSISEYHDPNVFNQIVSSGSAWFRL